jgi:WD40 repeat protein
METEFSSSIYAGSRVDAVGFSENDRYLICIRSDDFHSLQIFDWKNKTLIAKTFTGSQSIYQAVALKEKSTLESLVTIGSQHIKFWKSFSNGYLHCISPDLSELTTSFNFICCVSNPMNTVVGTDDGYLCVFQEYQLRQTVKAHSSAVVSLAFNEKSKSLYSGGVDGVVRVWNSSLECLKEISLESMSKSHNFGCKAIAVSSDNHVACIGTFGGDLLEFDIRKNQLLNEIACSRGHTMKLSGLACHPKHHSFVTTGDDAILR